MVKNNLKLQISSNWLFQRNVGSNLERAQTSEHCSNSKILRIWDAGQWLKTNGTSWICQPMAKRKASSWFARGETVKPFWCQSDILLLFLHNSYGTMEFTNCGNLVGADCMGNLRWANTEPSMHFRKSNTDPSMLFRKANTDPSVHFRKANTEFLLPALLLSLFQVLFPICYTMMNAI